MSNQELLAKALGLPSPQAKSPVYCDHEYVWSEVQVLAYDPQTDKFTVRVLRSGQLKTISKLSLQFSFENEDIFQ